MLSRVGLERRFLRQKITSNHGQAQTLVTLSDTLLHRLISGQLSLADIERETEGSHAD